MVAHASRWTRFLPLGRGSNDERAKVQLRESRRNYYDHLWFAESYRLSNWDMGIGSLNKTRDQIRVCWQQFGINSRLLIDSVPDALIASPYMIEHLNSLVLEQKIGQ